MTTFNEALVAEVTDQARALPGLPRVNLVALSLGFTLVELANGVCGLSFTPRSPSRTCAHFEKAGTLTGLPVLELAGLLTAPTPIEKSVGLAAVNALSRMVMDHEPGRYPVAREDIMAMLPLGGAAVKIGMVGHIGPFIPAILKQGASLTVVDDNPFVCNPVGQGEYQVTRDISSLAGVDAVLITGSSLVAGDMDAVFEVTRGARFIGIVGPSAGWLPAPAFHRGVHAVAGMKIVDARQVKHVVLEGGGTRNFMRFGQKYTLARGA